MAKSPLRQTTLADALYNLSPKSGSGVEYGRGVLVGVVSALMSRGSDFQAAIEIAAANLPEDYRAECVPDCWALDVQAYLT